MKTKQIALVTEAGNGLSSQFAMMLTNIGFEVVIAAKGVSFTRLIEQDLENVRVLEADFTKTEDAFRIYAFLKTHYGKLDVLVNNAEIATGFGQKLMALNMAEVKQLFDDNLFSAMQLTQTLLPLLKKEPSARILNITSALGNIVDMGSDDFHYSHYKMTAYSMAKAALDMFTVLLSKELEADNIQVKSFDPVKLKNCTHNSVNLCQQVQNEFLNLLNLKSTEAVGLS